VKPDGGNGDELMEALKTCLIAVTFIGGFSFSTSGKFVTPVDGEQNTIMPKSSFLGRSYCTSTNYTSVSGTYYNCCSLLPCTEPR
jgi:hypothetical protein